MPKGSVVERELICRACGQSFRSTRCGKAAFYCRRPECDDMRAAQKIIVRNSGERDEVDARRAERAAQRAREREERAADRQRRRDAEQIRRQLKRLAPRIAKAHELANDVRALNSSLARLEGRPVPAAQPSKAAALAEPTGLVSELLADVRVDLIARDAAGDVGRRAVQRAVVHLAHAQGVADTRAVLRRLAVECLAWELHLPKAAAERAA